MALDPQNSLDRLWAATQPVEPSAEVFDQIWCKVSAEVAELEAPAVFAISGWKKWGMAAAITAQAAALLIAGFVAFHRPTASVQVALGKPKSVPVFDFQSDVAETLYVSIGLEPGVYKVEHRPQVLESPTDMVAVEADVLGFMESYRTLTIHNFGSKAGETLFVSLDGFGDLSRVENRPQTPESETDVVAVESDVLNFMESLK